MRVLLSLGNRSRDSSNNSESYDDIVETSTNLEGTSDLLNRNQRYDPLPRVDTPGIAVAEGIELLHNSVIGEYPEQLLETLDPETNSSHNDSNANFVAHQNCSDTSLEQTKAHSTAYSTEIDHPVSNEETLLESTASISNTGISKRLRNDPPSEANYLISSTRRKMAVGGRFKNDSDDESSFAVETHQHPPRRFWVEPAENEAPFVTNSNPAVVTSQINDDDHDRPLLVAKENDRVGVMTASSDETLEEIGLVQFLAALKKRGFEMIVQEGDGNCLFRAVSLQVYGSSDNHNEVRERCMDYMAQNEEHFSDFIAASSDDEVIIPQGKESMTAFQVYIARKRISGVHGNHTEIQALSELFNRPVEVYTPESNHAREDQLHPMNIFHEEYKTSDHPIRLSYHDGNHYNAIIDPLMPTAGLGLGLPGLKVGLADKMQITKAITESDQLADQQELERVIKESQEELYSQADDELQNVLAESSRNFMYEKKMMALSDLDETNFALEQKVLASSMETYFRQEHGRKQRATVSSVGSSSRRRRCSPAPDDVDTSPSNQLADPAIVGAVAAHGPAVASSPSLDTSRDSIYTPAIEHSALSEEYPQVVQELVMNGFDLQDVIRAYEFVGDRFDDLLSFLLSSKKSS